jgi:hypothetical protein
MVAPRRGDRAADDQADDPGTPPAPVPVPAVMMAMMMTPVPSVATVPMPAELDGLKGCGLPIARRRRGATAAERHGHGRR